MAEFNRRIEKTISHEYSPAERKAITQDVVDFIRKRTREKKQDKDGKLMRGYSKAYKESNVFEEAGKSKVGPANLTLTGDMLDEMTSLKGAVGKIAFGYTSKSTELGKVEGHVTGLLGKTQTKPRDFLGISNNALTNILKKYPIKNKEEREGRAKLVNLITDLSKKEAEKQANTLIANGIIAREIAEEVIDERY